MANATTVTAAGLVITAITGNKSSVAGDYVLDATSKTVAGTITQLGSTTYVGSSGGNWSVAGNWTNGAMPIGNDVATVYIPSGVIVKYDSAVVDPVQSTIYNQGSIQFSNITNFIAPVVGSGSITQSGTGALKISGNNISMTGNVLLASGSSLILDNKNALGLGKVISDNGYLGVSSGIRLPSLSVVGPVKLTSDITTLGAQNYAGSVLVATGDASNPITLTTTNADISFGGTLNTEGANRSLTLNAGSGQVTFNGKVGDISYTYGQYRQSGKAPNIAVLDVAASKIFINADVQTVDAQIYRGPVVIGDNGSNGRVRSLLSVDPSITFTSTVDDAIANTHTLLAYAASFNSAKPTITFDGAVGSTAPLFAMDVVVGLQDMTLLSKVGSINVDLAQYFGDVTIAGDVSTMSNQTYTASKIALGGSQGSGILNFTSAQGKIIFNTRNSAPGGFVVKDGALLTQVNLNVLNDDSVAGFAGLPGGVAGRLNKSAETGRFAKIGGNRDSAGELHASLTGNNNFQIANIGSDAGGVTVSSPQGAEVCSSQQDSQGCTY
ncbi:hypothetical protein FD960_02780 [Polynucleobacter sp. AP-Nino-20-G2]|nr:hypothetical protein FD960_02780 [Polynucleobacter sp. AP-Nino-20-G2]